LLIALLTDFGPGSVFVGQVKAVLENLCPGVRTLDLCHDIEPGEPLEIVGEGAFLLERSVRYFPQRTVFLCVVDPGVGTARRVLFAEVDGRSFVGPDNGLLAPVIDAGAEVRVTSVEDVRLHLSPRSETFHGRDVFAPLAAHVAMGRRPEGRMLDPADLVRLDAPPAGASRGTVRKIDRWGNLLTDVVPDDGRGRIDRVIVGGRPVAGFVRTFGVARAGEPFITRGGLGTIEVACRDASASAALGIGRGAPVEVIYQPREVRSIS